MGWCCDSLTYAHAQQNDDGTIDYSKFVKIAAKQVLKIHAMDLVTIHLQVKMHQKGQEEVSCPNYPHLKRCAWYAILADPNHNRIMDFKRCVPTRVATEAHSTGLIIQEVAV